MSVKNLTRRERIHKRIRKKVQGTAERPRLSIFRSSKHIYAQLIDDVACITLASASSRNEEIAAQKGPKCDVAFRVGALLGKRAAEKGIKSVVFDRSGYLYHGRVAQLAEGARQRDENGNCTLLQF
jgi:large subunit ribosomal protein L18